MRKTIYWLCENSFVNFLMMRLSKSTYSVELSRNSYDEVRSQRDLLYAYRFTGLRPFFTTSPVPYREVFEYQWYFEW